MATNTTNNYFSKPAVGGDTDTWGTTLNANWDAVDSIVTGGTSITRLGIGTTNSTLPLICNAASATDIAASFSGLVGIGTTSPTEKLSVAVASNSGSTLFYGGTQSDRGLKITAGNEGGFDNSAWTLNASADNAGSMLAFKTRNAERMRIDSSGNVGIGTTTPAVALDVVGTKIQLTGSNPELVLKDTDSAESQCVIKNHDGTLDLKADANSERSNTRIRFYTDGTQHMELKGGNLGIGTDSPDQTLHVSGGAVRIESDFPRLYLTDTNSNSDYSIINDNGKFSIFDDTNGLYRFALDSAGNVGIGTHSPADELHLNASKSGGDVAFRIQNSAVTSGDTATLRFSVTSDANQDSAFIGSNRSNSLILGSDNTERMRIAASGDVGIGTDSPNAKLHVAGNGKFDGGTSTVLDVLCDDGGTADIKAMGGNQGNGRVYVGQSDNHGGGIEYSGESSPVLSGAGSDQIALYRRSSGVNEWTARNAHNSNDWEFRGTVNAATFSGVGSIQYTDVSVYSNTDHDQQISWTLPSGAQVINAVVTTEGFDIAAVRQIRNSGCVINRYDHEGNQTINIRVWHTQI